MLGRPRLTRNVDALMIMFERRWPRFLEAGERFGFVPRRADVLLFARETRRLPMRHQQSGLDVNIVFDSLPFDRHAVARATPVDLGGVLIPVSRPEDLIVMKVVAHR